MPDLHLLRARNLTDIPAMLRQMADDAEREPLKAAVLLTVDEDGDVQTYGWGRTDAMQSLATLHIAAHKLTRSMADGEL